MVLCLSKFFISLVFTYDIFSGLSDKFQFQNMLTQKRRVKIVFFSPLLEQLSTACIILFNINMNDQVFTSIVACVSGSRKGVRKVKMSAEGKRYDLPGRYCFLCLFSSTRRTQKSWLVRFNEWPNPSFWLVSDLSFETIMVFSYLFSTERINKEIASN